MRKSELPLPAASSPFGIAIVLVLYFSVYLKMNLKGMLEIQGGIVRKAGSK